MFVQIAGYVGSMLIATVALILFAILFLPALAFVLNSIHRYKDLQSGIPFVPFRERIKIIKTPDGVEFLNHLMKICDEYGRETGIFKLRTIAHSVFIVTKPETAEIVLTSSKNITKSLFYQFVIPWLGTGLLTSTGEKWHSRRKMLTPTFHFKILNDFLQVFNEQSEVMLRRLEERIAGGRRIDIMQNVTLCALDIICETAMGKQIDAQSNSDSEYVKAVYRISDIITTRIRRPHMWLKFMFRRFSLAKEHRRCLTILHQFTETVIRERRNEMEVSFQNEPVPTEEEEAEDVEVYGGSRRKRKLAFLDLLLQMAMETGSLTDRDIREEVDTFMFEGHDTTAAAVSWAIHLLGANPDAQKKLQTEIDQIFGSSDRAVTMNDVKELKYLECVIKESLRLFPSVPVFARHVTDECRIGGFEVHKGATVAVMTSYIHRDPNHFPDPERFQPERWLTENSIGRHPFAFIPFSAGPRNCIGQKFAMMEEKVLLASIFRRFQVTSVQQREDLKPCGELILRPADGIIVDLERRIPASPSDPVD